jgi:hypothetical protein
MPFNRKTYESLVMNLLSTNLNLSYNSNMKQFKLWKFIQKETNETTVIQSELKKLAVSKLLKMIKK